MNADIICKKIMQTTQPQGEITNYSTHPNEITIQHWPFGRDLDKKMILFLCAKK